MSLFKDKLNWKHPGGKGFKPHQDHPAWNDFNPDIFYSVAFLLIIQHLIMDVYILEVLIQNLQKYILIIKMVLEN